MLPWHWPYLVTSLITYKEFKWEGDLNVLNKITFLEDIRV